MNILKRSVIAVVFMTTAIMTMQAAPESGWYLNKPIIEIQFQGLNTINESELLPIVREYINKDFTNTLSWEIQSKLYALEYFEQIIPNAASKNGNYEEVVLIFDMQERPLITEILFNGNSRLRQNDLSNAIVLKKGDLVSSSGVNLDERALKTLYLSKGYTDVSISGVIERNEEDNTAHVVFNIEEGGQTVLSEIVFQGNDFASESALKGTMVLKAQSLFNNGIFQESILQTDLQLIVKYYQDRGFIDASIIDSSTEQIIEEGKSGVKLRLTINIDEGNRFFMGDVTFSGNQILTDEDLDKLINSKTGDFVNMQKLNLDFQRVANAYYEKGYVLNTINPEESRDLETNIIDYSISIIERQQAHIENIFINGNEKTLEEVILRELPFEVGDIFNITKIRKGMNNLYNTGYFANLDFQPATGSSEDQMDLTILIEEGKTTDINFGLTFSGDETIPISAFVKWEDKNFQGAGRSIGTNLVVSPATQSLTFNIGDSWLFDERISASFNIGASHSVEDSITQDSLYPIFSEGDDLAVPDPYDGHYVFSAETSYEGTTYQAGEAFPDTVTDTLISDYDLETDYAYASYSIPDEYTMSYESYDFSTGLSLGYTYVTNAGSLSTRTGLNFVTSYIDYDDSLYRPYNSVTRDNLKTWNFTNSYWLSAAWDARDLYYDPSNGYYFSESLGYVGGILGGSKDYLSSTTKAEVYFTLVDTPVLDNWNFKNVLKLHTSASFLFPQFGEDSVVAESSDKLTIDGMFLARGWSYEQDGESLWEASLEYRMPIIPNLITWDAFFVDAAAMWPDASGIFEDFTKDDIQFSLGTGIRSTNPSFPIGLYLVKRFSLDDDGIDWNPRPSEERDLFTDSLGLDVVLTFGLSVF